MKRALIASIIIGLIVVVFGLDAVKAATIKLSLTIKPNPFLEFLNKPRNEISLLRGKAEGTIIFSGNSNGIYYFPDPFGNRLEIITGETKTATLKWNISEESGAIILTVL